MTNGSRPNVEKIWSECLEGSTTIHSTLEKQDNNSIEEFMLVNKILDVEEMLIKLKCRLGLFYGATIIYISILFLLLWIRFN